MPELSLGSGRFGSPSPPSYGSQPPYQSKDDYEIDLSLRQGGPLTIISLEFIVFTFAQFLADFDPVASSLKAYRRLRDRGWCCACAFCCVWRKLN